MTERDLLYETRRNLRASKKLLPFVAMLGATALAKYGIDSYSGRNLEARQVQQIEIPPVEEQFIPVPVERLDEVIENPRNLDDIARERALVSDSRTGYDKIISEDYIEDIITIESAGNPRAKSRVGARGLMQIMPATWEEETRKLYGKPLDFDLTFNPKINREVGIHYLNTIESYLSKRVDNWNKLSVDKKQELIAAAYNGGMGRVVRYNGDIRKMPLESRRYVEKIRKLKN